MIKSNGEYDSIYCLLSLLELLSVRTAGEASDRLLDEFDDEYGECNCGFAPNNCHCYDGEEFDEDEAAEAGEIP